MSIKVFMMSIMLVASVFAQEAVIQDAPGTGAQQTWIEKVAEAVENGTAVTLTAEDVAALVASYAALEQRQPADIAVSETMIYVLSPTGAVILSQALPGVVN